MSDTERRWGERAWDVGQKLVAVLLMAICTYFFMRLTETEKKVQALEVKAAVVDESKNAILANMAEIKADIREIKMRLKP